MCRLWPRNSTLITKLSETHDVSFRKQVKNVLAHTKNFTTLYFLSARQCIQILCYGDFPGGPVVKIALPVRHYKFIKRTTERWTKFTKQLLIASSGHQVPRKAAHCLRREGKKNLFFFFLFFVFLFFFFFFFLFFCLFFSPISF